MNYSPRTGRRRLLALLLGGVTVGTTLIGGPSPRALRCPPWLGPLRPPRPTRSCSATTSSGTTGVPRWSAWLP